LVSSFKGGAVLSSTITTTVKSEIGLNACQRQKPAVGVKKAFDHKKRKMERDPSDPRLECDHCGRAFLEQALVKHAEICEKVFIKRRKVFNSQRQRALDENHLKVLEAA
jgi:hypothetical protein